MKTIRSYLMLLLALSFLTGCDTEGEPVPLSARVTFLIRFETPSGERVIPSIKIPEGASPWLEIEDKDIETSYRFTNVVMLTKEPGLWVIGKEDKGFPALCFDYFDSLYPKTVNLAIVLQSKKYFGEGVTYRWETVVDIENSYRKTLRSCKLNGVPVEYEIKKEEPYYGAYFLTLRLDKDPQ